MAIFLWGSTDVNGQSVQLNLLTDPELALGFSEIETVQVRFSGADGPIEGAAIGFTPLSDMADSALSVLRDLTDADGIAETSIVAGNQAIDFDISINVPDDDTVEPLTVRVSVTTNPGLLEAEYPGDFSTMQEAIDALADGGILRIAEGRHHIGEPVFVTGRNIVIQGAGSGLKSNNIRFGNKKRSTYLVGPEPQPVLDERGNVILPLERAGAMFNMVASSTVIRGLSLSGFDVGIFIKDSAEGRSGSTTINDVLVSNTGRGIASLSSGEVIIESCGVQETAWHGVVSSTSPLDPLPPRLQVLWTFIKDVTGAALYFNNTFGIVTAGEITGAKEGGIVCFECDLIVMNSHIYSNHKYGIVMLTAKNMPAIVGNVIEDTYPSLDNGYFGDGIAMALSSINVWDNFVKNSARAGLSNFGGHAVLGNNLLQCAGPYLLADEYMSNAYTFVDGEGNYCGCPSATGSCVVETIGFDPPNPQAPAE
jgi:hypothetical protein